MSRNNRTGSHLFFIEFIIVLFFFLIVSTVCLRLFARAHGITQRADALSHAQAAAASVAAAAEDILADSLSPSAGESGEMTPSASAEALLRAIAENLPGASLSTLPDNPSDQEGLVIFYDKDFQPCTADEARYLLTAALDYEYESAGQDNQSIPDGQSGQAEEAIGQNGRSGSDETLHISVTDYDHAPVYELTVTLHRPMTRKEVL